MDLTVLVLIIILYGIVMFLDFFFKSCMMLPYIEFIQSSGITVKFFRLQFHTNAFNRFINRFSSKMPGIYKQSFKLGFYVTMILFPIAICMMVISLFTTGSSSEAASEGIAKAGRTKEETAHLEILLPGVNLPLNQIGYYIIALLICSVVHEAGKL
jgi:S2P endopeptidase